ncbi:hypothetical protein [Streptomyces xanthochromogenes]|uniref:Uncharacterized protein n=1 Tax=Streptomyces xanthochromogenes TaxID=67384 RepID=A0ABQ3ASW4_9ACTN|nr:hypothetical protein [Streptomyces xanthochromogenes]GGY65756.1 hypothetical protein GCM10010326_70450 [Streptomyces xanthochromogenes]
MIRPEHIHVMAFAPNDRAGKVWLSVDSETLVEINAEQARVLTFELGDQLGLFVSSRDGIAEAAE